MTGYGGGTYGGGAYGGAVTVGKPFLVDQLGTTARLGVEVAFGADLTAADTTWTWTDITADVRQSSDSGVELTHGRADEASETQPATCGLELDNRAGAYSLGGGSVHWPNIRQGAPVRVRVDAGDGAGYKLLFQGYADSWQPSWDQTGRFAVVVLSASGVLRRLAQNSAPVLSSLRRFLVNESDVVAYWPCEDGSTSTRALSALEGSPGLLWTVGEPNFAADANTYDCSLPLPTLKNGAVDGYVLDYVHTGKWQHKVLISVPSTGATDLGSLSRLYTSSTELAVIDVVYTTAGGLRLFGFNRAGVTTLDTGPIAFNIDGRPGRLSLEFSQNGANVDYFIGWQIIAGSITGISGAVAATLGKVTRVLIGADFNHPDVTFGHVLVQAVITDRFADSGELKAFDNETTFTRITRLCAENSVDFNGFGDSTSFNQITDKSGPQLAAPLLDLLRDIEKVDQGILVDGLSAGLLFYTRRFRESRAAAMTIDVAAGQLSGVLTPVDDDQGLLNKVMVSRPRGSTVLFENTDGPASTAAVGVYDGSETISVKSDDALPQYAGWLVGKGSVPGYRYPTVAIDLAANPGLVPQWLAFNPGDRLLISNPGVAVGHPVDRIEAEVLGYTQTLTRHRWFAEINCAPYLPWSVAKLAVDSADTGDFVWRLDTGGAQLAAAATAGATSLSVTTTLGPVWTTTASDCPFTAEVAGIPVTVTAVSGAASPQTFTVTGSTVTKALPVGSPVSLYRPRVLGL